MPEPVDRCGVTLLVCLIPAFREREWVLAGPDSSPGPNGNPRNPVDGGEGKGIT